MQRSSLHTRTCQAAAARVIEEYSTSFSLATRLLPSEIRTHVTSIYSLVRVADEVVDGAFPASQPEDRIRELDVLEARVRDACARGFSTDAYVHAFAWSARSTGIGPAQWEPFFESMRADAHPCLHDEVSLRTYVHGSAEVVGEMCVLAFLDGAPVTPARLEALFRGARALGSAFQKVNFLRDLAEDRDELDRAYLPGIGRSAPTDAQKAAIVADIRDELDTACASIGLLPKQVRPAVRLAHDLFGELARALDAAPAHRLTRTRIRVPAGRKAVIAASALVGRRRADASRPGGRWTTNRKSA